eukprot:TRINITY_DN10363_c0_g1_i1.p1 TRINITY_DN10363_c0_g1~~TRINITY_DN10363_c0_g1_i1.p1  ORF type:complete len:583 (+),score=156.07 TRINITY_DN10363_c0_g1_i1:70-1818(+)
MAQATEIVEQEGPLSVRISSKSWKTRLTAYEEITKLFRDAAPSSPIFEQYGPHLEKLVVDIHAAAQEKSLEAVLIFLDRSPLAVNYIPQLLPLLIEKCLNQRTNTKKKAEEAILMMIEISNPTPEPVIASLIKGSSNKQPKISAASISLLTQALNQFGSEKIPLTEILRVLPELFNNADSSVRGEAQNLVKELGRWQGPELTLVQISTLRSAQLKELENSLKSLSLSEAPCPLRVLRSEKMEKKKDVDSSNTTISNTDQESSEMVAQFSLLDGKDVMSVLTPELWEGLVHTKWTVRKEKLDVLYEQLSAIEKLKKDDYSKLTGALEKIISSDSNVVVVGRAVAVVGLLSKSLRGELKENSKGILMALLENLKQKKLSVEDLVNSALDNFVAYECVNLPLMATDILGIAEKHKVPKVRADTLSWLLRSLKKKENLLGESNGTFVNQMASILLKILEDGSEDVRNACAETLGFILKIVGESRLSEHLEKLDAIKMKKIKAASLSSSEKVEKENEVPLSTNDTDAGEEKVRVKNARKSVCSPLARKVKRARPENSEKGKSLFPESSSNLDSSSTPTKNDTPVKST